MIKSDTYHDTWTNYLMEQDPLRYKTKPMVMDVAAADKTSLMKRRKYDGPSRAMLRSPWGELTRYFFGLS
jgi:hypothetical protein